MEWGDRTGGWGITRDARILRRTQFFQGVLVGYKASLGHRMGRICAKLREIPLAVKDSWHDIAK